MIIEFTGKNSGGVVAVETVRVVVKGRFLQPILYSSCHGTHPVDAELRIEQNPETGMITVNTVLLVNGKDPLAMSELLGVQAELLVAAPCPICGKPPKFETFRQDPPVSRRWLILECPCDPHLTVMNTYTDPIELIERWNIRVEAVTHLSTGRSKP